MNDTMNVPLLFKGDDFTHTDLTVPAVLPLLCERAHSFLPGGVDVENSVHADQLEYSAHLL